MSVPKQNLFQEKQRLRKEHELKLSEEKSKKEHLICQLQAKRKRVEELKRQCQANVDDCKRLQSEVESIRSQIRESAKLVEEIGRSQKNLIIEFSKLTIDNKQAIKQEQQLQGKKSELHSKYPPNFSFAQTPEIENDLAEIHTNSLRSKQISAQLHQLQREIEQKAMNIESTKKEKKELLRRIQALVKKEEEATKQIKQKSQRYNAELAKITQLQRRIKEEGRSLYDYEREADKATAIREEQLSYLPQPDSDEAIYISNQGLTHLLKNFDSACPQRGFYWTSDYHTEMPIFVKKTGPASHTPKTFIDVWQETLVSYGKRPALTFETSDNVWKTLNFEEYYRQICRFGRALIAHGITEYTPVMILGYNCVEWFISFYGSVLARYIPVGIYTTNSPETCKYIANHSEGEVVVLEDRKQLEKYYGIISQCPKIRYFVIYKDHVPSDLPAAFKGRLVTWTQFLQQGDSYEPKSIEETLQERMRKQKPGNCMSFVYTSGTTGMPKAVMLSHDNYITISRMREKQVKNANYFDGNGRVISFLPLSHIAGQLIPMVTSCMYGLQCYMTQPSAMQGELTKYLCLARPTLFLGVPRIWEKIQQKLTQEILKLTGAKKQQLEWAMSLGIEGTFAEIHGRTTPKGWSKAKKILQSIKALVGFDQCEYFIMGAAPMAQSVRRFFLQINLAFCNSYGMSQLTGPSTATEPLLWNNISQKYVKQTGVPYEGIQIAIENPDKEGKGEVCLRGRVRFMGYFKNEQANKATVDKRGFVHSGDEGILDQNNVLFITGRFKELIITAGGYKVPPVLIENQILMALPIVSQVVVIGDNKKYLTCLISLKANGPGKPHELSEKVVQSIRKQGSTATTIKEAIVCPKVNAIIQRGLEEANKKAISNAQMVQKFKILPLQLTVDMGVLTPTMKLKRKEVHEVFKAEIESMYHNSKL